MKKPKIKPVLLCVGIAFLIVIIACTYITHTRKTTEDPSLFMQSENPYADSLTGKTIINLGDSLFGNYNTETGISNLIHMYTNATVLNCGFGGTQITLQEKHFYQLFDMIVLIDGIVSGDYSKQEDALATGFNRFFPEMFTRLKEIVFTDQIVTLNHGVNDWLSSSPLDLYKEGLRTVLSKLTNAYPELQIVLISPFHTCEFAEDGSVIPGSWSQDNANGNKLLDYVIAMEEVAGEYGLIFIDCHRLGLPEEDYSQYLAIDGIHPNLKGRILLAERISSVLADTVQ